MEHFNDKEKRFCQYINNNDTMVKRTKHQKQFTIHKKEKINKDLLGHSIRNFFLHKITLYNNKNDTKWHVHCNHNHNPTPLTLQSYPSFQSWRRSINTSPRAQTCAVVSFRVTNIYRSCCYIIYYKSQDKLKMYILA
jgi:hypothetical protein